MRYDFSLSGRFLFYAIVLFLSLPQTTTAQGGSEFAVEVDFSPQACNGSRTLRAPSSWSCQGAESGGTTTRTGEISGGTINAVLTKTKNTASSIPVEDVVAITVYARKRLTAYNLTLEYESTVQVDENPDISQSGVIANAFVVGSLAGREGKSTRLDQTGTRRSDELPWGMTRLSDSRVIPLNGTDYYSLGTVNLHVNLIVGRPNSTASGTASIRIAIAQAKWVPQGGTGIGTDGTITAQCTAEPKSASGSVSPRTGNALAARPDPVATRGYPLATNIFVNSQSKFPDLKTLVGLGGAFTYGIAVRTGTDGNRYVIDEDGTELSFGVARDPWLQFLSTLLPPWLRPYVPQSVPEPGVYSRLLFIGSGWVLADAGPPGSLHAAGNYQYFFDTQGALQYLVDPSNNLQYVAYSNGVPVAIVDLGTKRMVRFEYESNQPGLIARIIENGGAAVSHLTYQSGRLIGIILRDANGVKVNEVAFGYDSVGRLSTLTADNDPASRISWSYTQAGTGTSRATMNWGSGATAGSSGLDYVDDSGSFTPGVNRTSRSNLQGGRTLIDFDAAGNLVREERPKLEGAQAPPVTVYGYDANRNVTSISDGLTALTISYNSLGKVTKTVDALGFERSFTYQGVDLLTASDSTGPLLTLKYEDPVNPHSPTSLTNGGGHTWRLTYNHFGQVLTVTPPAGSPIGVTRYTYDEDQNSSTLGYLKQIIDGAGDITRFDAYSPLGDLTVVTTSPREGVTNTTRFEYDVAQRVTKVVHPDGKSANKEYTGRFLTRAIDEAGTATGFSYCATCGALEKVQAPLAKTLTANHNGDHDVSKFIDARNKTTDYGYGLARELKQIRYPDGSVTNYQYDDTGRLSVVRDGRNISTTISYDKAGRVEKYTFSNGQTPIEFTYLLDGRISTMKDEAGTTTYRYTADRLLESVVYDYTGLSAPQTVRYAYNPDQTLRSMDWLSGSTTVATWSYSYDEAGRLTRVTNGFGDSTTYAYDHEGKVVSQKNSNGTEATYAFNEQRGWPTSIQWKSGAATFASYGLTYDQGSNTVGNLTKVQESGGSEATYGYDALYRLTSEARTGGVANTFGYDLSGNVTTKNGAAFAAYDDANKISAATHDGNGNILTSPILGADALTWDARNKLRSMGATSYKYDGGGHRVVRAEGGQTTLYIFSGDTLIGEVANGAPSAVYTWGADGLAAERLIGAQRSLFYHFGPQGETRQLTDGAGAVVATYTYDAYGQELQSTGTDTNPFRYGGKVGYYADRSNYLATARWYSPRLMRWLSRDPIGYRGGDNQYTYVSDRPIQSLDPSGLLKVYIWHPNLWTGSVGHASIQLDGAGPEGYISFWPSGNPFYSPHVSARTYKDDIEADGTPSRVITLSNLDETQILRWWRELQNSGNFYNLETRNCSNVAADALLIGLGLRPSPFIWTPRMVEEFAEEISTGIYDQKEWPLP